MRKYILPLCLLPLMTVAAQDLTKEITIDRDIVPEQRAAARPLVFPTLAVPTVGTVSLRMEENTDKAILPPMVAPFDPADAGASFPLTPWRGYADLGYFPTADVGISAGYALVDNATTRLGAWTQFDNNRYKGSSDVGFTYKTLDLSLGVDLSQKFGKFNILRVSTDLGHSRWNELPDDRDNLRWHLNGSFDGRINTSFTYGFSLGGGIFNNGKGMTDQSGVNFGGWLRGNVSEKAVLGVKAEGKFLHFSRFLTPTQTFTDLLASDRLFDQPGKTLGQVDIIPAAEFNGGGFYGKLGARFGISVNSGKTLHVAPDILLGINPDDRFGAWLRLGGGMKTNSFEDMMQVSRYADQRIAYNLSDIAFAGQFGLRVGPFRGASLTLTLDYAAANNWLMPVQYFSLPVIPGAEADIFSCVNTFAPVDLRSWKAGARFDWSYRRMFDLSLSYESSLGNGDRRSWLYWADRARHVAGAQLTLHPGEFAAALEAVKPLSVDVAFTARLDRSQGTMEGVKYYYVNDQDYAVPPFGMISVSSFTLGDAVNLAAGASWQFNPRFTIFARFNNLLGRRDRTVYSIPCRGFSGLFGIAYKF